MKQLILWHWLPFWHRDLILSWSCVISTSAECPKNSMFRFLIQCGLDNFVTWATFVALGPRIKLALCHICPSEEPSKIQLPWSIFIVTKSHYWHSWTQFLSLSLSTIIFSSNIYLHILWKEKSWCRGGKRYVIFSLNYLIFSFFHSCFISFP